MRAAGLWAEIALKLYNFALNMLKPPKNDCSLFGGFSVFKIYLLSFCLFTTLSLEKSSLSFSSRLSDINFIVFS